MYMWCEIKSHMAAEKATQISVLSAYLIKYPTIYGKVQSAGGDVAPSRITHLTR